MSLRRKILDGDAYLSVSNLNMHSQRHMHLTKPAPAVKIIVTVMHRNQVIRNLSNCGRVMPGSRWVWWQEASGGLRVGEAQYRLSDCGWVMQSGRWRGAGGGSDVFR